MDITNTNSVPRSHSRIVHWSPTTNHQMTQSIQLRLRLPDRPPCYRTIRQKPNQSRLKWKQVFPNCGSGLTCQHELAYAFSQKHIHSCTLSLIHFICNPLPLSNSHEQGRTLELERERMEEGIEGGKGEEEEKHQHLFMDLINILILVMLGVVCQW